MIKQTDKFKSSSFETEWTWTQQEMMPCVEVLRFSKVSHTPHSVGRYRTTAYYSGPPKKIPGLIPPSVEQIS